MGKWLARLQDDMKAAMKAGDTVTRDTLRLVISDIKKREVDLKKEALDETEEIAVLTKAVKSREDSVTQYDQNARKDLADKERAEIAVINRYLPKLLGEAETKAIVAAAIQKLGLTAKKDLGLVMKSVLADHKGQVDGKLVQKCAGELLV
jgi:uncharacterized protein YqeY